MARNVVVTDIDLGFNAIMAEIEELSKTSLLVGIQQGTKTHYQVKKGRIQSPGLLVAEYAAENEFGTNKIPQRSFMRTAFDENIAQIEKVAAEQYGAVIDGLQSVQNAAGNVGAEIVGLIQQKIRAITFPPNSPATIAMKGSSKPLIDFGQMIASVTWAVRTKK